jgi:hypothetical protein
MSLLQRACYHVWGTFKIVTTSPGRIASLLALSLRTLTHKRPYMRFGQTNLYSHSLVAQIKISTGRTTEDKIDRHRGHFDNASRVKTSWCSFFQNTGLHFLFLLSTEWPHAPRIWNEKHVSGWKNITDAVHQAGGKIYAQVSQSCIKIAHGS